MSKSLTYGGEAVFDGVMMRGQRVWSLAVRLPDGSIRVEVKPVPAWMSFARRVPLVRGMVSLLASVVLGTRALQESLSFRDDSRDVASLKNRLLTVFSALLIVGAFLMIPLWIAKALVPESNAVVFSVVEAVIRLVLFLGYLAVLGTSKDVQEVFAYHGAEHQTIYTREAGEELTPENVVKHSRRHPRCGSAFLLLVFVAGTLAHALVGVHSTGILALSRILLMPLITGCVYEFLRLTSDHLHTRWAKVLAVPGLALQRLTTRPAREDQIEVAIAALDAVVEADGAAVAPKNVTVEHIPLAAAS